jgi:hypothetical protein
MKCQETVLVIVAALYSSLALADDFKTTGGKEYKNATVSRVEPDAIVLKTKSGISKVYFVELPKDVQERFHYDAAKAAEFTTAEQAAVAQSNAATAAQQQQQAQERRRQAAALARQRQQAQGPATPRGGHCGARADCLFALVCDTSARQLPFL